jgi:hypothetical protein
MINRGGAALFADNARVICWIRESRATLPGRVQ